MFLLLVPLSHLFSNVQSPILIRDRGGSIGIDESTEENVCYFRISRDAGKGADDPCIHFESNILRDSGADAEKAVCSASGAKDCQDLCPEPTG